MFFPDTLQNIIGNDSLEFTVLTINARININNKVGHIFVEFEHHPLDIMF